MTSRRLVSFAGQWAAMKPEVLDKLDADQSIDVYADMIGAPAAIVVPDDKVEGVVKAIMEANRTGAAGDGKIFVAPVADSVRVRTGESGGMAIE